MAGRMFGSAATAGAGAAPTIAGFRVQTSVYGLPIPLVYGQARVAGNLIHMYPTTATPQLSQGSQNKFVHIPQTVTGYLYKGPIVLALSEGPIIGIGKVWRDKDQSVAWSVYNAAGWSLFLGTLTQSPWTFLTSNHPSDAVPYQLTAFVAHPSLELPGDVLSNYTWEVQGLLQYGGGIVDANPADILNDVLTDANHGIGFPSAQVGSLTSYSQYCIAAGLFLSPVLNAQGPLVDPLNAMFEATNSAPVWSDGKLKIIPYADQPITGNSVTYTPNVTPIYDLTDDDFIAPAGTDPVRVTRKKPAECYNQVLVQYEDRAHLDYNSSVQEAKDQASVEAYGLRPLSTLQLPAIKDLVTARYVAQLRLQRELNVRDTYEFTLGDRYSLLESMDLVTLTDAGLGLNKTAVRITTIEEDESGDLIFTAEDFPAGIASASRYGAPGAGGNLPANNTPPGPTTAQAIFEGPGPLLQSALEIWLAASGGANWGGCDVHFSTDNVTYNKVGSIMRKGNFGVLTGALATAAASPPNDTTHTLAVDLTSSGGSLVGGSASDLAALVTLAIVGSEFVAFQNASLSSAFHYNLTTLERGLFSSPIPSSHSIGSVFVRCDGALLKVPYPQGVDGQVVYFKFPAFNVFGLGLEDIGSVSAVSHTIGKNTVTSGLNVHLAPVAGTPTTQVVDLTTTSPTGDVVLANVTLDFTGVSTVNVAGIGAVGTGYILAVSTGTPVRITITRPAARSAPGRLEATAVWNGHTQDADSIDIQPEPSDDALIHNLADGVEASTTVSFTWTNGADVASVWAASQSFALPLAGTEWATVIAALLPLSAGATSYVATKPADGEVLLVRLEARRADGSTGGVVTMRIDSGHQPPTQDADDVETATTATQWFKLTERGLTVSAMTCLVQLGSGEWITVGTPTRVQGAASTVKGGLLGFDEWEQDITLAGDRVTWIVFSWTLSNGVVQSSVPFGFDRNKAPNLGLVTLAGTVLTIPADHDTKSIGVYNSSGAWKYEVDGSSAVIDVTALGTNGASGLAGGAVDTYTVKAWATPVVSIGGGTLHDDFSLVINNGAGAPAATITNLALAAPSVSSDAITITAKVSSVQAGWVLKAFIAASRDGTRGAGSSFSDQTANTTPALTSAMPTTNTNYTWPTTFTRDNSGTSIATVDVRLELQTAGGVVKDSVTKTISYPTPGAV